jgi:hypothetical protein
MLVYHHPAASHFAAEEAEPADGCLHTINRFVAVAARRLDLREARSALPSWVTDLEMHLVHERIRQQVAVVKQEPVGS